MIGRSSPFNILTFINSNTGLCSGTHTTDHTWLIQSIVEDVANNSMKYCISIRDGKKNCIHLCLYRSLSLFYLFGFAWWFDRYFWLGIYSSENCSNNRDYSKILNHILACCCFFFLRDSWSITVFLITSSRVSLWHCLLFRLYDEEHRENVWLPDVFFFTIQLNHAFKDMKWKKNTSCESSL